MNDVAIGNPPVDFRKLERRVSILERKTIIRPYLKSRGFSRDLTWIDNLISSLEANGEAAALTFVEGNYTLFAALGLDITNAVLNLFKKGHSDAAQVILDSQMTEDQIKTQLTVIGADTSTAAAARAQFYADLEKFALALLPVVVKLAAGSVTGGIL